MPWFRRYVNPSLGDAVKRSGHQRRVIAIVAGVYAPRLSSLIHARDVPATPATIEHLENIAKAINFTDPIFVGRVYDDDHTDDGDHADGDA